VFLGEEDRTVCTIWSVHFGCQFWMEGIHSRSSLLTWLLVLAQDPRSTRTDTTWQTSNCQLSCGTFNKNPVCCDSETGEPLSGTASTSPGEGGRGPCERCQI
jgi:hypothetical protein